MVLERIQERLPHLSQAKRRVATFILDNWENVAFLSIGQLARAAEVSESVVVRLANDLGYSGYPQLQDEIRDRVKAQLGLVAMYRRSATTGKGGEIHQGIQQLLTSEVHNLTRTFEQLDPVQLEAAVDRILGARRIVLLANRSSAGPAQVFALYLNALLSNTELVTNMHGDLFDRLRGLDQQDLAIGISYAWYTGQTVTALAYCRERGVQTMAITDSHGSPLVPLADITFLVRPESLSFYVSQIPTLGLINLLLYLVASRGTEQTERALAEMEQLYARFYVPRTGE